MDPNANLAEMLRLANALIDAADVDVGNASDMADDAARLAELVLAMHGWLSGGAMINASKLHGALLAAETDASRQPDARRVLRDERMGLGIALQTGDGSRIKERAAEALRVAKMWGVNDPSEDESEASR